MLNETLTYELWETERSHRIGLSLHEIEQILHALKNDADHRYANKRHHNIADRLRRLQTKIIIKHTLESLKD